MAVKNWSFCLLLAVVFTSTRALSQQVSDPDFSTRVEHPAFIKTHPRVGIDEAHRNFHTRNGRYKPFADLMESDGFEVSAGPVFTGNGLKGIDILIISNAMGEDHGAGRMGPAFTSAECDAVRDWVRGGGSLLLIADHTPMGDAAYPMAQRFSVEMGRGYVLDPRNYQDDPSTLVFSQENGLLGDHAIVRGRNPSERVETIVAFTGQSLSVPPNATALMKLSDDAVETFNPDDEQKLESQQISVGQKIPRGHAQGLAMPFGKGRVAIFGEAAMFSAQIFTVRGGAFDGRSFKMGMNVPGNDDRQFALNVMHWLGHLMN
jgi:hypothetical protein